MTENPAVVALVRDLMFAARVRGVAPDARLARDAEGLLEQVTDGTRLVLVELEADGAVEAIGAVLERAADARVVAFAPHVQEERIAAAREAGAEVLTRGAFVQRLPALVAEA